MIVEMGGSRGSQPQNGSQRALPLVFLLCMSPSLSEWSWLTCVTNGSNNNMISQDRF